MALYEATVSSTMEPAEAFSYLIDLTNLEEWDPGVTVAKLQEGSEVGPNGKFYVEANGAKLNYSIDSYQENEFFGFSAKSRFFTSIDKITITKTAGGCEVVYLARLDLNMGLSLLDFLLKKKFKDICDAAGKGLATALKGKILKDGLL